MRTTVRVPPLPGGFGNGACPGYEPVLRVQCFPYQKESLRLDYGFWTIFAEDPLMVQGYRELWQGGSSCIANLEHRHLETA